MTGAPGPIEDYRTQLEAALQYGGGTHSFEDVVERVADGRAQFWPGVHSAVVTTIEVFPTGKRTLHLWLAGGSMAELQVMYPLIEQWGREQGCTHVTITGRRGWARWMTREVGAGWEQVPVAVFEKTLS